MASFVRKYFFLCAIACAFLLLPHSVHCADHDDEDTLLQGLNSYRQASGLTALAKNDKANCLASKIADEFDDDDAPCVMAGPLPTSAGTQPHIKDYPGLIKKCKIDSNTTKDGAILPVCVKDLVPTLVLTNYTHSKYSRYINDSKYTGAGLGSEDDWMVVVLTTNSPSGSFASGARLGVEFGLISHSLVFVLGVFFVLS